MLVAKVVVLKLDPTPFSSKERVLSEGLLDWDKLLLSPTEFLPWGKQLLFLDVRTHTSYYWSQSSLHRAHPSLVPLLKSLIFLLFTRVERSLVALNLSCRRTELAGCHPARVWNSARTGSAERLLSQPSVCFAFTLVFPWESTHSCIPEGTGDSNQLVHILDPVCLCSSVDQATEVPWLTFSLETRQGWGSQTIASSFLLKNQVEILCLIFCKPRGSVMNCPLPRNHSR